MARAVRPGQKAKIKSRMDTNKHGLEKQKAELRAKIRAAMKEISPAARAAASKRLCAKLKEQPFFQSAGSVLFFAPLPNEADVWPLLDKSLAAGKTVALPRFDSAGENYSACRVQHLWTEIVRGQFGIREPSASCAEIPLKEIDLILVPGIAFDLHGRRLGRGKGFYDRLLEKVRGLKIGVALDEQIAGKIPVEAHDVRMDFILTPTRCLKIAG
jgi:5-formyltetrahydrofolate cyclo-ligase